MSGHEWCQTSCSLIYLATEKNSRTEAEKIQEQRRDSTDTEEGTTKDRNQEGPQRQDKTERGKAKEW